MSDPADALSIKTYSLVTAGYWLLMLSDGALRMLVLLHFHSLGFSPLDLATLFVLYEVMGIATNLSGGWIAARFGLRVTLYSGLGLQTLALIALTAVSPDWAIAVSLVYVMAVQAVAGIAKDLTKMSAKSLVKLLAPEQSQQGRLFRLVALLTGSKNAIKGLGFFVGASGLALLGFQVTLWSLAGLLLLALLLLSQTLRQTLLAPRASLPFGQLFSRDKRLNWLAAARFFLFGARDILFVVGVPLFFAESLAELGFSRREAFYLIGGFMAFWTIGYGFVQALTPRLLGAEASQLSQTLPLARRWVWLLVTILALLSLVTKASETYALLPALLPAFLALGLVLFGALFAINSGLHSYLVLAFSANARVTLDVGFYYMANSGGRLVGTVLSGLGYQAGGLALCLSLAVVFAGLSGLALTRIAQSD